MIVYYLSTLIDRVLGHGYEWQKKNIFDDLPDIGETKTR